MIVSLADDDERFCKHVERWSKHPDLGTGIELKIFPDPIALVQFLRKKSRKSKQQILVLLDLDFLGDKEGGLKTLGKLKTGKSRLRKVPVVIYTNSRDPSEIDKSYLAKILRGERKMSVDQLDLIAKALKVDPAILLKT